MSSFTVEFDANGGTGLMESICVEYGQETVLPKCKYIKDGYVFAGWDSYRVSDGTSCYTDGKVKKYFSEKKKGGDWEKYYYKNGNKVSKMSKVDGDRIILKAQWHKEEQDDIYEKIVFKNRKKILDECKNKAEFFECEEIKDTINDNYFNNSVKDNTVLISGLGLGVRGSMQYILKELNENDIYKDFKIYVRTKDETDAVVNEYIKQNNWTRTSTVHKGYNKYLESCKYMITESYFPYSWVKKENQVVINLWHGTPLKCLGLEKNGEKCHLQSIQQKNFIYANYLLYPNDYTKEHMLDSYKIESLLTGKALMSGYPRVAGMLSVTEERQKEIKQLLAPNGEKIYAYMPTFRGYMSDQEMSDYAKKLLDYLDANLRDDQILYVNLHHKVDDLMSYDGFKHIKKFPPLVDSYELLNVTEALISDYSSVFFDYLALRKQIILHIEDYETYRDFQGLYMDVEELPFDKARSKEEVLAAINRGKQYDDQEAFNRFSQYDSVNNHKKICQLLLNDENNLNLIQLGEKDTSDKAVIYSNGFRFGKEKKYVDKFVKISGIEDKNVWLSCDSDSTKKNLSTAYPYLYERPVFGTEGDIILSSLGEKFKRLYLRGLISFNDAMDILRYDYRLMYERMFGKTRFGYMFIYDAVSPEMLISLALSEAEHIYIFVQKDMIENIESGNSFVRDSLRYASYFADELFVESEDWLERLKPFLGKEYESRIKLWSDIKELKQSKKKIIEENPPMYKIPLTAHALGGINGKSYLNTRECFEKSVKNGHRYLEVDLRMTKDEKLVCSHGWGQAQCEKMGIEYNPEYDNMTEKQFLEMNIFGMHTLNIGMLYELIKLNPQVYMHFDISKPSYDETKKLVKKLVDGFNNDDAVLDRCVLQIRSKEMLMAAREVYNFKYIAYCILKTEESVEKTADFCAENGICAIALHKRYASKETIKYIKSKGLSLSVFTSDNLMEVKELLSLGADTIVTNKMKVDML